MVGLLLEDSHYMNDLQIVENGLDQDDYKNQVVFSLYVSYHHLDNKSISHLIFLLYYNRVITSESVTLSFATTRPSTITTYNNSR